MNVLRHASSPYLAFVRAAFLKTMAYRLRYYTGIVSYLVYVSTYYFLWKAFYSEAVRGDDHGRAPCQLRRQQVVQRARPRRAALDVRAARRGPSRPRELA